MSFIIACLIIWIIFKIREIPKFLIDYIEGMDKCFRNGNYIMGTCMFVSLVFPIVYILFKWMVNHG